MAGIPGAGRERGCQTKRAVLDIDSSLITIVDVCQADNLTRSLGENSSHGFLPGFPSIIPDQTLRLEFDR